MSIFMNDLSQLCYTHTSWSRKMVGQLLSTAASINYSGDVAKAINFIGRRPGYGSSVPVTVALLQRPILCPVFLDHVPARLTPY